MCHWLHGFSQYHPNNPHEWLEARSFGFITIKSTTCSYLDVTVRIGAVDNFHTTSRFFLPDSLDRGIPILTVKRVSRAVHRQNDQEPQQRPRVGGRTWMIVTLDTRKA